MIVADVIIAVLHSENLNRWYPIVLAWNTGHYRPLKGNTLSQSGMNRHGVMTEGLRFGRMRLRTRIGYFRNL